jgi:quercetin dioxygenase-like cupin family protein
MPRDVTTVESLYTHCMNIRYSLALLPLVLIGAAAISADDAPPQGYVEVHADRIPWQSRPSLPGTEIAILLGEPSKPGPLVVRVRMPPNQRVLPHTHPDARTYTVLEGEWQLGFGDKFDAASLRSYKAGSLYRLPTRVPHFQAAGPAGAVVQIESIGPTSTDFIVQ